MRNCIHILFVLTFLFSNDVTLDKYNQAKVYREAGDYDKCLSVLFDLEKSHINYNYDIADIYLNDFSNHRIALEHFNKVLKNTNINIDTDSDTKNIYKKSLFMSSYIQSNYLGMYTDGYDGYKLFLSLFPNDELIESVKYELNLLEEKELLKNKLLNK